MTKQQKEDRAYICAKLGITKEQYDEIDRACKKADVWVKQCAARWEARRAAKKKS